MDESRIQSLNRAMHDLFFALRVDRLGSLSAVLKGIPPMDLHILKMVQERADLLLGQIRAELRLPQSTLTSAVNRLEKRGLVRRVISPRDRRSYGLALTPKGRKIQAEHDRVDLLLARSMLEALDDDAERRTLIALMEKIGQRLG